jgi:hypothetical protein
MKRMSLFVPGFAVAALVGAGLAGPALAQNSAFLSSNLFGNQVRDGGAESATADFNGEADPRRGRLCYYLEVHELADADGAAIHEGEAGASGPSLLPLPLPGDRNEEVCVTVDKTLLEAIMAAPAHYYVAISAPGHPEGAIRGQLD